MIINSSESFVASVPSVAFQLSSQTTNRQNQNHNPRSILGQIQWNKLPESVTTKKLKTFPLNYIAALRWGARGNRCREPWQDMEHQFSYFMLSKDGTFSQTSVG